MGHAHHVGVTQELVMHVNLKFEHRDRTSRIGFDSRNVPR